MIWRGDDPLYKLFRLYLLTNELNDLVTTNLMVDEIVQLSGEKKLHPGLKSTELAYKLTVPGNPNLCYPDWILSGIWSRSWSTLHRDFIVHQLGSEALNFPEDVEAWIGKDGVGGCFFRSLRAAEMVITISMALLRRVPTVIPWLSKMVVLRASWQLADTNSSTEEMAGDVIRMLDHRGSLIAE
jgi:hypothetical protein